jgi:Fe-S-cluster containining protein
MKEKKLCDITFEDIQPSENVKTKSCINCVECCDLSSVITYEELHNLIKIAKCNKKIIEHIKQRINLDIDLMKTHKCNFKCIFIENNQCMIYANKPYICNVFDCKTNPYPHTDETYKYTLLDVYLKIIENMNFENQQKKDVEIFVEFMKKSMHDLKNKYMEVFMKTMIEGKDIELSGISIEEFMKKY